jgi:hypothetical protein
VILGGLATSTVLNLFLLPARLPGTGYRVPGTVYGVSLYSTATGGSSVAVVLLPPK